MVRTLSISVSISVVTTRMRADEWFLPRVESLMSFQLSRLCECPVKNNKLNNGTTKHLVNYIL